MTIPSYCLGFAFDLPNDWPKSATIGKTNVALIRKLKPEWQAGSLNGIGGKIEDYDETPRHAMVREFSEETGYKTRLDQWQRFHTMGSEDWQVECFRAFHIPLGELYSATDEEVLYVNAYQLPEDVLFNLRWLIPLAMDPQPYPCMQVYR